MSVTWWCNLAERAALSICTHALGFPYWPGSLYTHTRNRVLYFSFHCYSDPDLGDAWPLTVEDGLIACQNQAVTFTTGGVTYAVNGTAKDRGLGRDIDPIWAVDPAGITPKMSIGPLIDRGRALCR